MSGLFSRTIGLIFLDLLLVVIATMAAVLLRDNLEFHADRVGILLPYLTITTAVAAAVLLASGASRAIWRYASMPDYMRLAIAAMVIVGLTVVASFSYNRMSDVARSIPILQWLLISVALIGSRVAYRQHRARRAEVNPLMTVRLPTADAVLVVGVNPVTELFVTCVNTYASSRINIVGLLTEAKDSAIGRTAYSIPVLGRSSQLADVIRTLEVHGVEVKKLVVTALFSDLDESAKAAITELENSTTINVDYMAEQLDFSSRGAGARRMPDQEARYDDLASSRHDKDYRAQSSFRSMPANEPQAMGATMKRLLDICLAVAMLVTLTPLLIVVSLLAAAEIGTPVLFWQYRPGLRQRRFKLFKLRTMKAAHDSQGRRLSDAERLLPIGRFLRRTRIDELPQLINVIRGDMSFVGPRPLLPIDQKDAPEQRLLARPGLTGWAQVNGGRLISDEDKIALDLWYIKHRSFWLDIRIMALTVPMILFGDRANSQWIEAAWNELLLAGDISKTSSTREANAA